MTVRDEIKKMQEQVEKNSSYYNQVFGEEARSVIESFIMPKFSEISQEQPDADCLEITLYDCLDYWTYTSNIDCKDDLKKVSFTRDGIYNAIDYAKELGICVNDFSDCYCPNIRFFIPKKKS